MTADDYSKALSHIATATRHLPLDHWAYEELDNVWERLNNELGQLLDREQQTGGQDQ